MGRIYGMLLLFTQCRDNSTLMAGGLKNPIIPFGAKVEDHPISAKDQAVLQHFGKKGLPGLFVGYALHAGEKLERRSNRSRR